MHNFEPQLWGRNAARWDVSISLHAKKKMEYWQPDKEETLLSKQVMIRQFV